MSEEIETPEVEETPKPKRKKAAKRKAEAPYAAEKGMRRCRRAREVDGRLMAAGPPKIMHRHGI